VQAITALLPDGGVLRAMSADHVLVLDRSIEDLTVHTRLRTGRPDDGDATVIVDIGVYDGAGRVVAAVDGLHLAPIDAGALGATDHGPVEDWLYEVAWEALADEVPVTPVSREGGWLVVAGSEATGAEWADGLRAVVADVDVVVAGPEFRPLGGGRFTVDPSNAADLGRVLDATGRKQYAAVVHVSALDTGAPMAPTLAGALHLTQALVERGVATRLWFVTRGAQPAGGVLTAPEAAPLWAFARSVRLEHPELEPGCLDLDPAPDGEPVAALVATMAAAGAEDQIAIRGGRRYGARLVRSPGSRTDAPAPGVRPDATYLVTGGLGGLGLATARRLVDDGARHLALLGRRPPAAGAQAEIELLAGAGAEVVVLEGDVASRDDVARVLSVIGTSMPPLRGVFHAAGVVDDGAVNQLTWARFATVLAAKVDGTRHLDELTADLPIDHFVMYSSMASAFGAPGQANYAAANAYLGAVAHRRTLAGRRALAIDWGPWAETGMAVGRGVEQRARSGVGSMTTTQALDVLDRLMAQSAPHVVVAPVQWPVLLRRFNAAASPYLSAFAPPATGAWAAPDDVPRLAERIAEAPERRRREIIRDVVRDLAARVLGLPAADVPDSVALSELGLDSLMAVELRNLVVVAAGAETAIPATLVYDYPSIDAIADHLADGVFGLSEKRAPSEPTAPPPGPAGASLGSLLDELTNLSDAEVERLLTERAR
jgi:NAD(P)-dependent dehydrogenase (short-subunit alcohol dehydrogenase family)